MAQAKQDMGCGSVKKLMLQLMIPAVVAQVVNLLYNIVDRIYIGTLGASRGSADRRGTVHPHPYAAERIRHAGGRGRCTAHRHRAGTGDKEQAEKIISNSFTVLLLFAVVLTVAFMLEHPPCCGCSVPVTPPCRMR